MVFLGPSNDPNQLTLAYLHFITLLMNDEITSEERVVQVSMYSLLDVLWLYITSFSVLLYLLYIQHYINEEQYDIISLFFIHGISKSNVSYTYYNKTHKSVIHTKV